MRSRRRRRARREFPPGDLMLAAMVDMMINILVFLLTLYGTSPAPTPAADQPELAASTARDPIRVSTVILISTERISVGGESFSVALRERNGVIEIADGMLDGGRLPGLEEVLAAKVSAAKGAWDSSERDVVPELSVQCDRRVPWEVLAPVLRTAGHAGFGAFRFTVRASGR